MIKTEDEDFNKDPDIKDEDIIIPDGVTDEEFYRKWKKAHNKWKYSPDTFRTIEVKKADGTIDKIEINFTIATMYFERYINRIPQTDEYKDLIKELRDKKLEWDKIRGTLASLKCKAFGVWSTEDKAATRDSILDCRKTEILELFGKFYNTVEIHRIVIQEYKLEVNAATIENFRVKHLEQIKELQEEYVKDYSDVRLTHKKSRLEELNDLYVGRKNIYNATKKGEDYKLLLQTIEQVKREVEGDTLTITSNLNINIEQTLVSHIYQELIRGLAIKEIVIARVAARTNTNPLYLISRLNHSFYKQFNGFDVNEEFDINSQISLYPSQIVYNFDEIASLAEGKKMEKYQLSKLPDIKEENVEIIPNIKDALLAKIRNNMGHIENEKEKLDIYKENSKTKGRPPKNNFTEDTEFTDVSDDKK